MSARQISTRDALRLGCFALATAVVLLLINGFTESTIQQKELQRLNRTLSEVLPDTLTDNALQDSKVLLDSTAGKQHITVYRGYLQHKPAAVVIQASATDGYSGSIDMLIGLTYDGVVTGVRVIKHSETPGLGDDIELKKSDWILSFDGKSVNTGLNWKVKRDGGDFDQFTGATITPRAVVQEVHSTIQWYLQNRQNIFSKQ